MAERALLKMKKSPEMARSVRVAIMKHMGSEGCPARSAREKYGDDFKYSQPATKVGRLVYECDILTQLTKEGFGKFCI